jgi:hypothetical protein
VVLAEQDKKFGSLVSRPFVLQAEGEEKLSIGDVKEEKLR